MAFAATKWYLDLVTEDGSVVIGVCVRARYRGLWLSYDSVAVSRAERSECRRSLRCFRKSSPPPRVEPHGVRWDADSIGLQGTWRGDISPASNALLEAGQLTWTCLAPAAEATVELDGRALHGGGYVEMLELRTRPDRLPIDTLRWGRWIAEPGALAGSRSLVWIRWDGPRPKTLILRDGVQLGGSVSGDDGIDLEVDRLRLEEPRTLQQGSLGSAVLSRLPVIGRCIGRPLAAWDQTRWLSCGWLQGNGSPTVGWAIHERVTLSNGRVA